MSYYYKKNTQESYYDNDGVFHYTEFLTTADGKKTKVEFVHGSNGKIEKSVGENVWDESLGEFDLNRSISLATTQMLKNEEEKSQKKKLKIGDKVVFNTNKPEELEVDDRKKENFLLNECLHKTILIRYSHSLPKNKNGVYTLCLFNEKEDLALIADKHNYFLVPFSILKEK